MDTTVVFDVTSYAGLTVAITLLVSLIKLTIKREGTALIEGYEPLAALALSLGLGVLAKAGFGYFATVDWLTHVGTLLIVVTAGSQVVHDKVLNPLINKES